MAGMRIARTRLGGLVADNPLLAVVAAIGFSVSFQTVAKLAVQHGLPGWPPLYPIGIDIGILALTAESRLMLSAGRGDFVPRSLAWLLTAFTVYANVHGSPSWDWLGRGMHAVMPCLWVVFLELTRRRLVAARRTDLIPASRWAAAPLQTPLLWQRMRRDGITDYRLALELEQARLHARDLVRAAPPEHRAERSSLLSRRIRTGRLPDAVRKAVRESLNSEWSAGWEADVAHWVTAALAMPEHVAASLENARRQARETVSALTPEPVPATAPAPLPDLPAGTPGTAVRARSAAAPKTAPKPALKLTAARSRAMTPDHLAAHASAMIGEYGETAVSINRVKTDLSVGTDKAKEALRIARADRARVVTLPDRKQA